MARAAPGTATADFFIVSGDLTSLDAQPAAQSNVEGGAQGTAQGSAGAGDPGYAVFGRVVEGMDIVHAMLDLPRAATAPVPAMEGQMLQEPVKILTARRVTGELPLK
jgi:peptidyl-prolyl cis-trans isomerase A (cyclophilin A)